MTGGAGEGVGGNRGFTAYGLGRTGQSDSDKDERDEVEHDALSL